MKTAKGSTYTTLLAVNVDGGYLSTSFKVPVDLGTITCDTIAAMIPHINERITTEKKPGATYERCLQQIEFHRDQLIKAYVKLFETYVYATVPQVRTSPAIKAAIAMLQVMPTAMLKQYARLHIGDKVDDFILPDDTEVLIDTVVTAMNKSEA